jgi:hypothetical protein
MRIMPFPGVAFNGAKASTRRVSRIEIATPIFRPYQDLFIPAILQHDMGR